MNTVILVVPTTFSGLARVDDAISQLPKEVTHVRITIEPIEGPECQDDRKQKPSE